MLSQTEDATLGHMALMLALEAKSLDGTYNDASIQLAIWLAAGLEKMRELASLPIIDDEIQDDRLMPFVGLTVVGHQWELHIAVKSANVNVNIYGPVSIGDTRTYYGVFQILHVLAKINKWGRRAYYPWLINKVLQPLHSY